MATTSGDPTSPRKRLITTQAVLTVLGLSGVALIPLPFVNDFGGPSPLMALIDGLYEPVWPATVGPCVVLPCFISAGYLRWLVTGELARWERELGYALALTVVALLLLAIAQDWGKLFTPEPHEFLPGLAAATWFVIQNHGRATPRPLSPLVAMQAAYLPFALLWLAAFPGSDLIEGHTPDIGIGGYLAVVTVFVYTAQAVLWVWDRSWLLLRLLPLGVVWVAPPLFFHYFWY